MYKTSKLKGNFWSSKLLSTEERGFTTKFSVTEWYTEMIQAKIYFENSDDITWIKCPHLFKKYVRVPHTYA